MDAKLWLRIGDQGDYQPVDGIDEAVEFLREMDAGSVIGWVDGGRGIGLETERYYGGEFVSLFWGDSEANLVEVLSDDERRMVEGALQEPTNS